jgi:hypothetical protein
VNASLSQTGGAARTRVRTYLAVPRGQECRWVLRGSLANLEQTQQKLRSAHLSVCVCVRAGGRARVCMKARACYTFHYLTKLRNSV